MDWWSFIRGLFVLKDDSPEQLIAAIRTVAAGDALLSPTRDASPPAPTPASRANRVLDARSQKVREAVG